MAPVDVMFSPTPATTMLRARLFLSSFAPLFILLALRFDGRGLRASCLAIGVAGIFDTVRLVMWQPRRVGASPHAVTAVVDHGSQVAAYLATYLLPFLPITQPTGSDLAAYALFLVVVAVIYIQSDMAEINPTLYVIGWRVVSLTTAEGWSGYAIVQSPLGPGSVLRAVHLDAGVLVEAL